MFGIAKQKKGRYGAPFVYSVCCASGFKIYESIRCKILDSGMRWNGGLMIRQGYPWRAFE